MEKIKTEKSKDAPKRILTFQYQFQLVQRWRRGEQDARVPDYSVTTSLRVEHALFVAEVQKVETAAQLVEW